MFLYSNRKARYITKVICCAVSLLRNIAWMVMLYDDIRQYIVGGIFIIALCYAYRKITRLYCVFYDSSTVVQLVCVYDLFGVNSVLLGQSNMHDKSTVLMMSFLKCLQFLFLSLCNIVSSPSLCTTVYIYFFISCGVHLSFLPPLPPPPSPFPLMYTFL